MQELANSSLVTVAGSQPPIFYGVLPLGAKKGIGITVKSISGVNSRSCVCCLILTLRAENRDELLAHADLLRSKLPSTAPEGTIMEFPEQDFSIEGIKTINRWVWQMSLALKITTANI